MITVNELKARLRLMKNLAEEARKIGNSICDEVALTEDDDLYGIVAEIIDGERTDLKETEEVLKKEGYLEYLEEGEPVLNASLYVDDSYNHFTIYQQVPEGLYHIYTGRVLDSEQVGVMFYEDTTEKTGNLFFAEIPQGEYANRLGIKNDNKEIRVHIWDDLNSEKERAMFWIKRELLNRPNEKEPADSITKQPTLEQIENVGNIMKAEHLIREAVEKGVLQANEDKSYVYISTEINGSYIMVPETIHDAAKCLIESGNYDLFKEEVDKAELKGETKDVQ